MANYKLHIYIAYLDFLGCQQNHTKSLATYSKRSRCVCFVLLPQSVNFPVRMFFIIVIHLDEKSNEVDLSTSEDWDVKTITSALKLYMR